MATTAVSHGLLRDRTRLYLQVILVIDLIAYLSDLVAPLVAGTAAPETPASLLHLRVVVTATLVGGWALTRFTWPPRSAFVALESGVTVALAVVYALLGLGFAATTEATQATGLAFTVIGVVLLLVVRAALVPSPVWRTVAVGLASLGGAFLVARDALGGADAVTREGLVFMSGAIVIATAVTTHVIYGLRREVHRAMRLGQYELGRQLGAGGMGVVYEATHLMLRRPTAVKLLPKDAAAEESVGRFEREVRQTSRLEHPNSVRIYDYGRTPEGQFYYAMEYLDGVTLQRLVEIEGPLGEARTAHVLAQAAHALAEAHALGLVHRDVKPANVMLCDRGGIPDTVKVLDFGLVKVTEADSTDAELTHANAILGTPHYMAPEAISEPDAVGPASDVYALGAVGFFLLTGRAVFPGKTVVEVCAKHLEATPESPSAALGRQVDPDLEELILACLEKRPEARPADGAALADALERLDVPGWSVEDARGWWREFGARRDEAVAVDPTEATQLAVDVQRR